MFWKYFLQAMVAEFIYIDVVYNIKYDIYTLHIIEHRCNNMVVIVILCLLECTHGQVVVIDKWGYGILSD